MNDRKYPELIGVALYSLLSALLSVGFSIILNRVLSVEDRGGFQLFLTNVVTFSVVAFGGVGYAIGIQVRKGRVPGFRRLSCGLAIYSLLWILILSIMINGGGSKVLFLGILLYGLLSIALDVSKIESGLSIYKAINVTQPLLCIMVFMPFLVLGREGDVQTAEGLWLGVCAVVAFSSFYIIYVRLNSKFSGLDRGGLKEFFAAWWRQNLFQVFGVMTVNLDKYLIAWIIGLEALGLYSVFIAIDGLVARFYLMAADYHYSKLWQGEDRVKKIAVLLLIMSVFGYLILILFGEGLIGYIFGGKYLGIFEVIPLLVLSSIVNGMSWLYSQNMLINERQPQLVLRQLISLIMFVLIFMLLKGMGLYGLAWAMLTASVTRLLVSLYFYRKYPCLKIS